MHVFNYSKFICRINVILSSMRLTESLKYSTRCALQTLCAPFRPTITHRPTVIATSTLTQTSMGTRAASTASHRRRSGLVPASRTRETIIYGTNTRARTPTATRRTPPLDVVQGRARKLLTRTSPPTGSSMARIPSPVSTSVITHLYL